MIQPQDQAFYAKLAKHLFDAAVRAGRSADTYDPIATPLFFHADGSIDRERTLDLPCYAGMEGK